MAIVNFTPDSFYAASRMLSSEAVAERVAEAVRAGATIVDVGGYSSRPGAEDVPLEEEWRRVDMALEAISSMDEGVVVSILRLQRPWHFAPPVCAASMARSSSMISRRVSRMPICCKRLRALMCPMSLCT